MWTVLFSLPSLHQWKKCHILVLTYMNHGCFFFFINPCFTILQFLFMTCVMDESIKVKRHRPPFIAEMCFFPKTSNYHDLTWTGAYSFNFHKTYYFDFQTNAKICHFQVNAKSKFTDAIFIIISPLKRKSLLEWSLLHYYNYFEVPWKLFVCYNYLVTNFLSRIWCILQIKDMEQNCTINKKIVLTINNF